MNTHEYYHHTYIYAHTHTQSYSNLFLDPHTLPQNVDFNSFLMFKNLKKTYLLQTAQQFTTTSSDGI